MFEKNDAAVCLDFGNFYTKIVVTNRKGELEKTILVDNTLGYAIPKDQKQVAGFAGYLEEIFTQNKLSRSNIRLAMPEKLASTQIIEIPTLTDVELATSIQWQAQQYIPIPKEDLVLSYQVLFRPEKKDEAITNMRVLLVGIHKQDLDNLLAAFQIAGLDASLMETETLATLRNLSLQSTDSASIVLNLGATGLDITIVRNNEINLVVSHQTGSETITRALMAAFNLPKEKAEEYKRTYGINPQHFEGKIAQVIAPVAQTMINDIKNTISFYNSKSSLNTLTQLFFAGGGSLMPGFPELLATNFNLEVAPLNIFGNITGNIPEKNHLLYPVAIGLAKKND